MTATEPSQPLTDAELALMERLWAPHQTYVRDLLDEVYRLRAKVTGLQTTLINAHEAGMSLGQEVEQLRTQVQDYHKSADEHIAKFERQHERLMEAKGRIDAARKALFDDAFEGHAQRYRALAHALGFDQSGEGQANA